MRISKFIKPHKDILIEYIYDDGNNISEQYQILVNIKDNTYSYAGASGSSTHNNVRNQLFKIDGVTNNYGLINTENYPFLQLKDYSSGFPVRHDTIKIHLPINYTFGEYIGCYVRVYTFDYNNQKVYDLSNFYFDSTDVDQSYLLNYSSPPLLFQEKLWGKNIRIDIPSTFAVANQRQNGFTKSNSINFNLTNGTGLSLNSPIFIDFHFLTSRKTVNKVTTYYLSAKNSVSLPQTPDFEKIGIKIEHSVNGDFFEIYGVYNDNIAEFNSFILNSVQLGNRYYVTYTITLFEQNIRGKSFTITVTDNFNEKIEYRPIIKYSTTTAIIDVEMNVIDAVDDSSIFRKASYGMLQDEVAKYSLNLTKINIKNASKPKIYNIKSAEGAGIFGNLNTLKSNGVAGAFGSAQIMLEPIKVNYTVLADKFNVVTKSQNVKLGKKTFFGMGLLQLMLQPFDNIIQLIIASDVSNEQIARNSGNGGTTEYTTKPEYLDMSNMGEIKMVIKNEKLSVEVGLYMASNQVDLTIGQTVFKIPASKMSDVRKIYDAGTNVFYVTSTQDSGTVVIYSGLFVIYDSKENINSLNSTIAGLGSNLSNNVESTILNDPNSVQSGTAIVTRKIINGKQNISATQSTAQSNSTSTSSSTIITGTNYTIDSNSSLIIDGYTWTSTNIKKVLNLDSAPTNLKIQTDSLYSNGKYLEKLPILNTKLNSQFITTQEQKAIYDQTLIDWKNNKNVKTSGLIATAENGKKVILSNNGTWKYA